MTAIKQNRIIHVKSCDFQLFNTSGCPKQLIRHNEGGKVANTEILLVGNDFSKFFLSAGKDSVGTIGNNLRSASKSSSGSVIDPLLIRLPLNFGKILNIYATMPKNFS